MPPFYFGIEVAYKYAIEGEEDDNARLHFEREAGNGKGMQKKRDKPGRMDLQICFSIL